MASSCVSSPNSPMFTPEVQFKSTFSKRPKAPKSCYPNFKNSREEIIHTTCSPTSTCFSPSRSSESRRSLQEQQSSPKVQSGISSRFTCVDSCATTGSSTRTRSPSMPCQRRTSLQQSKAQLKPQATKTFNAIDGALRAVHGAVLLKSKLDDVRRPSLGCDSSTTPSAHEDLESLCGTECTESTACSSSFAEEGIVGERRTITHLRDARRLMKERMAAEERSTRFARGIMAKLDDLRLAVIDDDFRLVVSKNGPRHA